MVAAAEVPAAGSALTRRAGQRLRRPVLQVTAAPSVGADQVDRRLEAAFSLVPAQPGDAPAVRVPAPRPAVHTTVLAYAETADAAEAANEPSGKRGLSAIKELVDRSARANDVSPALAHALVRIESNYNAKATGRHGEVGLLQINPRTARAMGFKGSRRALYDPATNLAVGMKYLGQAKKLAGGDVCGALLRYNAGLDARRGTASTNRFCAKVKSKMAKLA